MYIAYPECFLFPNFEILDIDDDKDFYRQELDDKVEQCENSYQIIDDEYETEIIEK